MGENEGKLSGLLRIYQLEDGFCYTSDSLFLYHFAKGTLSKMSSSASCLDVGAGCGVLGLLITRDFGLKVGFIERDWRIFDVLKQNISCHKAGLAVLGDFLNTSFDGARFDFIISNPPFYSDSKQRSLKFEGAKSSSALPLNLMLQKCARILTPRGKIAFCYDARESASIFSALDESGLYLNSLCYVHGAFNKSSKLALCLASREKRELEVRAPIFASTKEGMEILKSCNTYSIKVTLGNIE